MATELPETNPIQHVHAAIFSTFIIVVQGPQYYLFTELKLKRNMVGAFLAPGTIKKL